MTFVCTSCFQPGVFIPPDFTDVTSYHLRFVKPYNYFECSDFCYIYGVDLTDVAGTELKSEEYFFLKGF